MTAPTVRPIEELLLDLRLGGGPRASFGGAGAGDDGGWTRLEDEPHMWPRMTTAGLRAFGALMTTTGGARALTTNERNSR